MPATGGAGRRRIVSEGRDVTPSPLLVIFGKNCKNIVEHTWTRNPALTARTSSPDREQRRRVRLTVNCEQRKMREVLSPADPGCQVM